METKHTVGIVLGFIVFIVLLFANPFTIIGAGERGVVTRFGKVQDTILSPGLNIVAPFIDSVHHIDIQVQKEQQEATAASQDLQNVDTTIAVNYILKPDQVTKLWQNIGEDYKSRVIDPAIQEAVKASTANYTAEQLITKREVVRQSVEDLLKQKLDTQFITVTQVSIVNFKFSNQFEQAIEAKVTAEQNALAAKNKLDQVKYEAEQRIAQAEGEAKAIQIQAAAIQQQGGANYVQLQAIQKWNGQLPQNYYAGAPLPFVNITK